jgi:hypothetical protein
MIAVAAVGVGVWYLRSALAGRGAAIRCAARTIPSIAIESVRPEQFNSEAAWEVRGTDPNGTVWLLDISVSGEVLMKEPVDFGPPRSEAQPSGR